MNWTKIVKLLELFIEAIIRDMSSRDVEDSVARNHARNELIKELEKSDDHLGS
jgi:hypothetical protein